MKLVLAAVNAKFIHCALSVLCLKNAVCDICECITKQYSINDTPDSVIADIYAQNPDCVAFSCYIWNIDFVTKLSSALKSAKPDIRIIVGGYEVMFDAEDVLKKYPHIDAVIRGEGEIPLREYIKALSCGKEPTSVCGITYRKDNTIVSNPDNTVVPPLDEFDFPYRDGLGDCENKIIYYESSRGCPYSCTYCISGNKSHLRFLDVQRVKKELAFFMENKVPLVKFVDRTFNANLRRAKEILRFIADNPSDTVFHMELAGDNIDEEMISIISQIKKDSVRFEIGVQTTNPDTMKAIERQISFDRLSGAVRVLMAAGTVHIHLDLIAGLPYEDLNSFKKSFDDVISLKPHVLQLGFLKLLKGSKIRRQAEEFGYVYRDFAPYEVISNKFISFDNILEIKRVEDALERFYNSGDFSCTMDFLLGKKDSPYELMRKIGEYLNSNYPSGYAFSVQKLFEILHTMYSEEYKTPFLDALKKDYFQKFRPGKRPAWMNPSDMTLTPRVYEMFRNEEFKKEHFPAYYDIPAKEVMKHIFAERFSYGVLLFDYKYNTVYDVSAFF